MIKPPKMYIYAVSVWEWKNREEDMVTSGFSYKHYIKEIVTASSGKRAYQAMLKFYGSGRYTVEKKVQLLGQA